MTNSSDLDWRLEHAARAYADEVSATHKLKDRMSYLIGLFVTPVSGAIYFLYSSFKGEIFEPHNVALFALPLGISAAVVLAALAKLFVVIRKEHQYSQPPSPSQLSSYYQTRNDPQTALLSLKQNLLNSYESAVDHNSAINERRSNNIIAAQKIVAWSFPFILIAALQSLHQSLAYEAPPIRVEVINSSPATTEHTHEQHSQSITATTSAPCAANDDAKSAVSAPSGTRLPAEQDDIRPRSRNQ